MEIQSGNGRIDQVWTGALPIIDSCNRRHRANDTHVSFTLWPLHFQVIEKINGNIRNKNKNNASRLRSSIATGQQHHDTAAVPVSAVCRGLQWTIRSNSDVIWRVDRVRWIGLWVGVRSADVCPKTDRHLRQQWRKRDERLDDEQWIVRRKSGGCCKSTWRQLHR